LARPSAKFLGTNAKTQAAQATTTTTTTTTAAIATATTMATSTTTDTTLEIGDAVGRFVCVCCGVRGVCVMQFDRGHRQTQSN